MDISYFSGKVEAYLRYQRVPYERREGSLGPLIREVGRATGVMQVPAMRLADGRWLRESTAMLAYFEAQPSTVSVLPADPAEVFLAQLIEDYCDEWLWRPAMWWRWMPAESSRHLGLRIAREVLHELPLPAPVIARLFVARQRQAWLSGDGMHPGVSDAVRDMYREELTTLQGLLADRDFLLGHRPSLVDFAYFGPMFRHFYCDPDSERVMRREAPRVHAWVRRLWTTRAAAARSDGAQPFVPIEGPAFDSLLERVGRRYLPYLQRNAEALRDGEPSFDLPLDFGTLRGVRTHAFRCACRNALRDAFLSLPDDAQRRVRERLQPYGGVGPLLDLPAIHSGLDEPLRLPLEPRDLPLPALLGRMLGSLYGHTPS
jgi:glutathione S-transferase